MTLKKLLLNLYFWPFFALITTFSVAILPFLLLHNYLFTEQPAAAMLRKRVVLYGRVLVRFIPFMAPVTLDDLSGGFIPPVIYTPNHLSAVDPYLFGAQPDEVAFVTTWPFRIPVYKWVMRKAGYINADLGWEEVMRRGEMLLAEGASLIIWPEGHRSRDGRLGKFKNGAFQLACATGRPIVPVCISGSHSLLPPGKWLLTPSRLKLVLLPPVAPPTGASAENIYTLKNKVRNLIACEQAKGKVPQAAAGGAAPCPSCGNSSAS